MRPYIAVTLPQYDESDKDVLPDEPCRFCHATGDVYFVIDDSPFGKSTPQVVACDNCKNSWTVYTGMCPEK